MKKSKAGRPNTVFQSCVRTLRIMLTNQGESPAIEVTQALGDLGYRQSTIDKAKKALRVQSRNEWKWSLPYASPPSLDPQLENDS